MRVRCTELRCRERTLRLEHDRMRDLLQYIVIGDGNLRAQSPCHGYHKLGLGFTRSEPLIDLFVRAPQRQTLNEANQNKRNAPLLL